MSMFRYHLFVNVVCPEECVCECVLSKILGHSLCVELPDSVCTL